MDGWQSEGHGMNYLIYTRVSPKGSDWCASETTVGDQAAQCRAYVAGTDPTGEVVEVITDEFESGGSSKRPGWLRILAEAKSKACRWDVLVVRHLDRFSRSIADAVNALELLHANGRFLIATAQGLNSSTPSGRGVINILLSIAQMEREFCSERTTLKMRSIAERGGWPSGIPPFGYMRAEKHDNRLRVDPRTAPIVQQMFKAYADGQSSTDLAREHGMQKTLVLRALRNRVYLGKICYDGKEFEGKHEAIIDNRLFTEVQKMLPQQKTGSRPRRQTRVFTLTGLVRCRCGRWMTPSSANGNGGKYHYYQCTDAIGCGSRVRAESLEEEVAQMLSEIILTPDQVEGIIRDQIIEDQREGSLGSELAELEKADKEAKGRQDKLLAAVESGMIAMDNAPTINARLQEIAVERGTIAGTMDVLKERMFARTGGRDDMRGWCDTISQLAHSVRQTTTPEELRSIISATTKEIRRTEEGWQITLLLPGSPNRTVWLPERYRSEPIKIYASRTFEVYCATA